MAAALALTLATACAVPLPPAPPPDGRPAVAPAAAAPALPPAPGSASAAVRAHFERVQAALLSRGLLRTEAAPMDAPFNARMLTENFIQIALRDEYVADGGGLLARPTAAPLRRWDQPVRLNVEHGPATPPARRARDLAEVAAYAARLSRIARLPIGLAQGAPNFHILYLTEEERRAYAPRLRELVPGIDDLSVRTIAEMPLSTFCLVFAFSRGPARAYHQAVAVIRAEHPDLLRLSCLHEELAQGLGLANDYPRARPSIFNDDEEFAFLTVHDELLLRILYDPRLRHGMTEAEAVPIVRLIASELLGGTG